VWSWGCGADGQLGRGNHSCHDQCLPHQVATPMKREQREAEALGEGEQQEQHGEKAVQIAAGWNHSLALTGEEMTATTITLGFGSFPKLSAQGSVLCWGSSRFNQIGSLAGTAEPSPKESAPPVGVCLIGLARMFVLTVLMAHRPLSSCFRFPWQASRAMSR